MESTIIASNLIWTITGKLAADYKVLELNKSVGGATWEQWAAQRIEQGSIVAKLCVTISNKKSTVCPASRASDIGFTLIPLPIDIALT